MILGKSLLEIIQIGGYTMYVLLFCSVLSIGIFLERAYSYWRASRVPRDVFMAQMNKDLRQESIEVALTLCRGIDNPFARVALAGISSCRRGRQAAQDAMQRAIALETMSLERHTSIVGTIGSTAVYIGLFGTVLGIIRAFHDISMSGVAEGGIHVVIGGISEALVCTATGLLVAIPAVVVFNWFVKSVDSFVADMELCASEMVDLLEMRKT